MVSMDRKTALAAGSVALVGGRFLTLGAKTGDDTEPADNYQHSIELIGVGNGEVPASIWTSGEMAPGENVRSNASFEESFLGGWRGGVTVPSEGSLTLHFDGDVDRAAFDRGIRARLDGGAHGLWQFLGNEADGPAFIGDGRRPAVEVAVFQPESHRDNLGWEASRHFAEWIAQAIGHSGWAYRVYYDLPPVDDVFNTADPIGVGPQWVEHRPHGIWAKDSNVALSENGSHGFSISANNERRAAMVNAPSLDPSAGVRKRFYTHPNYATVTVGITTVGFNLDCTYFGSHGGWYVDDPDENIRYCTHYGMGDTYDAVNSCGQEYQAAIADTGRSLGRWAVYTDCCSSILTSRPWGWTPSAAAPGDVEVIEAESQGGGPTATSRPTPARRPHPPTEAFRHGGRRRRGVWRATADSRAPDPTLRRGRR